MRIENNIPLDIKKAVEDNKILYNNLDTKKVIDFILKDFINL
ncbi:hypothetical protein [Caminibacter mediatlanticus]|uniref:Glycyl-tRNA synthetase subunit beta n=1 Tax=Caminibacter mediatlanticus TB-2 TaxID=391592 RepID=A0AAI9F341_9BACT|nr:hypothetical protein [Caminibacter mediatlanticus]EDM24410.1 glycyl-tRNA synthetase subunit beta [Caminibacter mediatlanticus TB-2]